MAFQAELPDAFRRSRRSRSRQPDGDVASPDKSAIVGGPVRDAVLRLVLGMDSRLHPDSLITGSERSGRSPGQQALGRSGAGFVHQRHNPAKKSRERYECGASGVVQGLRVTTTNTAIPAKVRMPYGRE